MAKTEKPKPDWWPECPYPESIFTMNEHDYATAIPDPRLRTACSGFLGRVIWNLCSDEIWRRWCEHMEDNE
jgi:hypothetical protein